MCRMAFGLSIAPRFLRTIVSFISKKEGLGECADAYVDDIVVITGRVDEVEGAYPVNRIEP